jgi:hypothetical protein
MQASNASSVSMPWRFADFLQHAAERADVCGLDDAVLVVEQVVNDVEILVLAGTQRHHIGRHIGLAVDRVLAIDELHLAGRDVFLLQLGKDFVMEILAGRAGRRGVFDQRDRRVCVTDDVSKLARDIGRRFAAVAGSGAGAVAIGCTAGNDCQYGKSQQGQTPGKRCHGHEPRVKE